MSSASDIPQFGVREEGCTYTLRPGAYVVMRNEEGLLALYLCRPRRVRQGVITAWEFAVLINATAQPVAIPPERWVNLPVPEEVARPVLRRKHREVRNEE